PDVCATITVHRQQVSHNLHLPLPISRFPAACEYHGVTLGSFHHRSGGSERRPGQFRPLPVARYDGVSDAGGNQTAWARGLTGGTDRKSTSLNYCHGKSTYIDFSFNN